MTELYEPLLIKQERKKINDMFDVHGKANFISKSEDDHFIKLLKTIEKWDGSRVEKQLYLLNESDIERLSGYVVSNHYHVNCNNIYLILNFMATVDNFRMLLYSYENRYKNKEAKEHIAYFLVNNNAFQELLERENVNLEKFKTWITQDNMLDVIGAMEQNAYNLSSLKKQLMSYGIFDDTELMKQCLKDFYLYCSRSAYMEMDEHELANIFSNSKDEEYRIKFVINVMDKLSLDLLRKQSSLYTLVSTSYSNDKKDRLEQRLQEKSLLEKYHIWKQLITIKNFFENSDRVEFWSKYVGKGKMIRVGKDEMYMDFGEIVVTEFSKNADGPAYFWKKDFFNQAIKYRMYNSSKHNLKDYMLHDCAQATPRPDGFIDRREHKSKYGRSWDKIFEGVLGTLEIHPIDLT